MVLFVSLFLICLAVVLILKVLSLLISEATLLSREELSAYECGFEHHNLSRVPFSLRYFFLTLVFLLFDLEIVFILFLPSTLYSSRVILSLLLLIVFLVVLFLGLVYE